MNVRRGFLLALIALLLAVSFALIKPFLQYVLLALLLAFVLYPLQRRLEPRFGEAIAASVLIVGAVIAFFIPFAVVGATVAGDAMALARQLQTGGFGGFGISRVESLIQRYTGQQIDIASRLSAYAESAAQTLAGSAPDVFSALTHVLVGLGLLVFLLFFLLKDGEKLYGWVRNTTPLPETVQDDLYTSLNAITWAVLLGHVLVAVVQGGIAGLGLIVTGIPNAVFWTFLMIVLSLIPVVGSILIWGPAAIYLVTSGQTVAGVALAIWGLVVVSATDDFLRPILVDRYAELNPSIIIVGVIGGVYLLGFMGLFIGPILVGALKVVLELFDEYYEAL
ncbi:AI-2E family transporter [Halalkalicoccus sp. NIPERK01]|uniref:AI-2E family transporter n=1 Tax=Halalkalicoccus sp. NIPERK01 TaxID=3053469 RepID=UPI00256F367D|nr:AI-2E family transporter [Halalkalicoccus sp. NIPERK01]MDL5362706.1 AI-2E family transporter [Halalkalicoccus sp. NIPERK01]